MRRSLFAWFTKRRIGATGTSVHYAPRAWTTFAAPARQRLLLDDEAQRSSRQFNYTEKGSAVSVLRGDSLVQRRPDSNGVAPHLEALNASKLNRQMRCHLEAKSFICEECAKGFQSGTSSGEILGHTLTRHASGNFRHCNRSEIAQGSCRCPRNNQNELAVIVVPVLREKNGHFAQSHCIPSSAISSHRCRRAPVWEVQKQVLTHFCSAGFVCQCCCCDNGGGHLRSHAAQIFIYFFLYNSLILISFFLYFFHLFIYFFIYFSVGCVCQCCWGGKLHTHAAQFIIHLFLYFFIYLLYLEEEKGDFFKALVSN